jgi:hypothetical protein
VDKGSQSCRLLGKIQNKDKRPASWKRNNSPEAAHAVTTSALHCGYCHTSGHTDDTYFKKKREVATPEKQTETSVCDCQTALTSRPIKDGIMNDTTFIVDTGACSHRVYSKKYLKDVAPLAASITEGNEDLLECTIKVLMEVVSRTAWESKSQYI